MALQLKTISQRGKFSLNVDLKIPLRGVTTLTGPSGCGKTTLLRVIAGLEKIPNAKVIFGEEVWQGEGIFLPPPARRVGYVFQEPSLFTHLSVRENIAFAEKRSGPATHIKLEEIISLLELSGLLDRREHELSGGEKQRIAIVRALAAQPQLLLMDEPISSLDPERKNDFLSYLESLKENLPIPVIYVSHSEEEVRRLADHNITFREGCFS